MIITISGLPGSGKTTAAKEVARQLSLKHYSIGDLRGRMAMEKGMTLDEFNALGEKEAFTDRDADEYQKRLCQHEDEFVIDGRLSFHFIPRSIKVFLKVDEKTGAGRIFNDPRSDERQHKSVEEVMQATDRRMASDRRRYKKYYNIDPFDESHYDMVIDTTHISIGEVVQKILDHVKNERKP